MEKHNILIIGNGLDKSLGFETSFQDFKDKCREFRLKVDGGKTNSKDLFSELYHSSVESWFDFEKELGQISIRPGVKFKKQDYLDFVNLLQNYLSSINYGKILSSSNAYKFLNGIPAFNGPGNRFKETYKVINFNYTDTAADILGKRHPDNVSIPKNSTI